MENNKRLFCVYGTLKRGHYNNVVLGDAKFLGEFTTEPDYTMYDGGYPVVERQGDTPIQCEVFETADRDIIEDVFGLEGSTPVQHSSRNWYDWDVVKTPYGDATIFVMDRGKSRRTQIVESGKWR